MTRVCLASVKKTPGLWNCTPESIVRSIIDAASLGLEPVGGPLGHGYLVPYKDQCQFIISYQGLVELARRSGEFKNLEANCVYENDKLVLRYGFERTFIHEPYIGAKDRGNLIGAYCLAVFTNGEQHVTYMSKADIEKRREASRAKDTGPWRDWYDEMCLKTVIKKAAKLWPKTPDIATAFAIDEGAGSDAGVSAAKEIFDAELESATPPEPEPPKQSRADKLAEKMSKKQEQPEDDTPWDKHLEENGDSDDSDDAE